MRIPSGMMGLVTFSACAESAPDPERQAIARLDLDRIESE